MITKEKLKEYANKLMFDMEDSEYDTLLKEFDVLLKKMDIIDKIEGLSDYEPMTFPFSLDHITLREDRVENTITTKEALFNAKKVKADSISVPKVVGE